MNTMCILLTSHLKSSITLYLSYILLFPKLFQHIMHVPIIPLIHQIIAIIKPVLLPENTPIRIMVLLFCRCYSNSVSFIELLRIFASYMVKLVLKYCVLVCQTGSHICMQQNIQGVKILQCTFYSTTNILLQVIYKVRHSY